MQKLTQAGNNVVADLSQRYGFSTDAVTHMLFAVLNGNGSMAQFNHPEFAGSGQWMRGGMIMLGDMFNNYLKGNVDALCSDIADILAREPGLLQSGSFQSQSQNGADQQSQSTGASGGSSGLFAADPSRQWWPQELGVPNATGSQNNMRYAYFANAQRLAVDSNGQVWVYDTLDHQIGGFSQQQGGAGGISFSSQYGTINLSTLPVVMINNQAVTAPEPAPAPAPAFENPVNSTVQGEANVLEALEKLGGLFEKGILTEAEFSQKKAELLQRL